ncbi:hypothetical protein QAD02_014157 [Eretmocerus hayati]|uniref:Uncharacterized protein n=1 Tax=Eretmocerus hayati TaxID=131215 RepID=A0ACC2P464_9HYME|nr:hypothetical protein QAD02_014157 [Eretmocerus hayati]
MKYESYHRGSKLAASSISGSQNLLKTLAIRNQLKFAHLILSVDLSEYIQEGKSVPFQKSIVAAHFCHVLNKAGIKCLSHVEINGTRYAKDDVVVIKSDYENEPDFGEITNVYTADEEVYFVMRRLKTLYFDNHYQAYCVKRFDSKRTMKKYSDLPKIAMCSYVLRRAGATYVIPRHTL